MVSLLPDIPFYGRKFNFYTSKHGVINSGQRSWNTEHMCTFPIRRVEDWTAKVLDMWQKMGAQRDFSLFYSKVLLGQYIHISSSDFNKIKLDKI